MALECEHVALSVLMRREPTRVLEYASLWWEPLRLKLCELPLFSGQQTMYTKRKPAKGQHPIAEQHQPRFSSKKKNPVVIRGEPYTTEPSIELASANNLPSPPTFPAVESHLFLMKRHRDTDCSNMKLITVPHVHPVGYKPGNAD